MSSILMTASQSQSTIPYVSSLTLTEHAKLVLLGPLKIHLEFASMSTLFARPGTIEADV
jgi:hypothetical protein